jgi:hypothetical protein
MQSGKEGRVYYWNEVSAYEEHEENKRVSTTFVHQKRLQMLMMIQ